MSFRIGIPPRKRAEGRLIGQVRRELDRAFAEEHVERGLSQSDLARSLDMNRAAVSRRLRGETNLTLRTVAAFAWAMNRRVVFKLVKRRTPTQTTRNESGLVLSAEQPYRTSDDHRHVTRTVVAAE